MRTMAEFCKFHRRVRLMIFLSHLRAPKSAPLRSLSMGPDLAFTIVCAWELFVQRDGYSKTRIAVPNGTPSERLFP